MERRRSVRYEIRLACRLRMGNQHEGINGMTLNLGCTGALVAVPDARSANGFLGPGDPIKVAIFLPPNPVFGQRALDCEGKVVRLHAEDSTPVVAIQFEQVAFKKVEPGPKAAVSMAVM